MRVDLRHILQEAFTRQGERMEFILPARWTNWVVMLLTKVRNENKNPVYTC